jgi:hypothetical protein
MGHLKLYIFGIWIFDFWNFQEMPHEKGKMGNLKNQKTFSRNSFRLSTKKMPHSPRKRKNGELC